MNWTRILLATLAAGVTASLTDWLFMGVLFHEKYKSQPQVWRRPEGGPGETRAVVIATALGFLTCFCFVVLCARGGGVRWEKAWHLAALIWLMLPLPMLVTQYLWMKMHPLNLLASALGWLVKLLVSAIAVAWLVV